MRPPPAMRERSGFRLGKQRFSALTELEAADGAQDKGARKQPEQERYDLDAEAGHDCPLVRHQAAIGLLRDIGGQDLEKPGLNPARAWNSDGTGPGQSTVTRTPCGASSARIASVNDST